ncbi:MAG: chromosome segregation protein [Planctomycetaceae bacterium]|nr:chromosome segregation protein [Planctomycetaceae bacterium]
MTSSTNKRDSRIWHCQKLGGRVKSFYGIRQFVLINSGNYLFSKIELSNGVHFVAPNNRGKSTLVNAIQFLYVDDFNSMKFGRRSHDDTRKHYFGDDQSYLVFECLTTSGIQCMLVRGLGQLRSCQFERYVYDGEFREADYLNNGEIREFEAVRSGLADRHLAKVKNSELWQVLAGNIPSSNGKVVPRFNIVPIRRRDEYLVFRDVFVRLLSLTNADARALKELIIEAHARDLGERRIDVAAEYKVEFDRAESAELELDFIREVAGEIDSGRDLRKRLDELTKTIVDMMPIVLHDHRRCLVLIDSELIHSNSDIERLRREQQEAQFKKESALKRQGALESSLRVVEMQWQELLDAHKKWSPYSAEFLESMRENKEREIEEIAVQARRLEQSKSLDLQTLRRRIDGLTQRIEIDEKALLQWEKTAAAELFRAGLTESEFDSAFRIINPGLLKLVVGESVTVKKRDELIVRIRNICQNTRANIYTDAGIEVNVSETSGPDFNAMRDPVNLRNQIALDRQELDDKLLLLRAAEDQSLAQLTLDKLRRDCDERSRELNEHDSYAMAWAARSELELRLAGAKRSVVDGNSEIINLEQLIKSLLADKERVDSELGVMKGSRLQLESLMREFQQGYDRVGLEGWSFDGRGLDEQTSARPQDLGRFIGSAVNRLNGLIAEIRQIEIERHQLRSLQEKIAAKSRHFEMQQRYFNNDEDEWSRLIETRDSLNQLEGASLKNWDALFTTLGARFNAIVNAVSSIRTAVERINRGLKSYQVSNLRTVHLALEVKHDTYSAIEALARQGSLFQNRDDIDFAKTQLRRMIERNEPIELESLFELRIRIQKTDESWHQASSLDEIGSTGTGMTVKAMIFIHLIRAVAENQDYRLHFYIDGLGELDDSNLEATASLAVSKGIIPITADPRIHLEPLAHPQVTVYSLGQDRDGRFYIDRHKTYHAIKRPRPAEPIRE